MIKSSRSRRLLAMSAVATMGGLGAITVTAPRILEAEPTDSASERRVSGETLGKRIATDAAFAPLLSRFGLDADAQVERTLIAALVVFVALLAVAIITKG